MDDVLSAVDSQVARHLVDSLMVDYLRNKTRILCTHHAQFLQSADWVLVFDNGQLISQGIYVYSKMSHYFLKYCFNFRSTFESFIDLFGRISQRRTTNKPDVIGIKRERSTYPHRRRTVYRSSGIGYCFHLLESRWNLRFTHCPGHAVLHAVNKERIRLVAGPLGL